MDTVTRLPIAGSKRHTVLGASGCSDQDPSSYDSSRKKENPDALFAWRCLAGNPQATVHSVVSESRMTPLGGAVFRYRLRS